LDSLYYQLSPQNIYINTHNQTAVNNDIYIYIKVKNNKDRKRVLEISVKLKTI